jgi:hypothetical protein
MELREVKHRVVALCVHSRSKSATNVWMSAEQLQGKTGGIVAHCYACGRLHRFPQAQLSLSSEAA